MMANRLGTVVVLFTLVSVGLAGESLRAVASTILGGGSDDFGTCVDACYNYEVKNKQYRKELCELRDWVQSGMDLKFWKRGTGYDNCLHEDKPGQEARELMIKQLRSCEARFKKDYCPNPGPGPHPDRCVQQCVDWELKNTEYRRQLCALNNWASSGMKLKFWRSGGGFGDCLNNSRDTLVRMVTECEKAFKAQAC